MSDNKYDVIIIGGGLAGLCSAIHLSKHNVGVLLIEKNSYPKHKVCGEYVSNEVLPYLNFLGFDPFEFKAKKISKFELTTHNNKRIIADLPLGGFGISRYKMDFELFELAVKSGATVLQETVTNVTFSNDVFKVETKTPHVFLSKIVIGAFGKRSNLDVRLNRAFIQKKSPYLGVKIHVSGNFDEHKVALHNFKGGYCGVSKVENNHINLCYITNFKAFKAYKNLDVFQEEIIFKNQALKQLFKTSIPKFDKPLSISQISFKTKKPVENHMIMCGDAAGMIHPLCGNGMGMAIQSAKLACDAIINYLEGKINSRSVLEEDYSRKWKNTFSFRLKVGHLIAFLFRKDWLAPKLLFILRVFPALIPKIIKMTHGEPIRM